MFLPLFIDLIKKGITRYDELKKQVPDCLLLMQVYNQFIIKLCIS